MKRRTALQHMVIGATGLMFLPGCNLDTEIVYNNIPLERDQRNLLSDFIGKVLPKGELGIETLETPQHFILNNINQCYDQKDIDTFLSGLKQCQLMIKEKFNKKSSELSIEEEATLFQHLNGEESSKEMKYFFSTTKNLAVQQFTGSEKFMTEQLDYEMVPSRYIGCTEI